MMDELRNFLYQLSNALLLPTLIAVLILMAWTAVMLGGIIREWMARGSLRRVLSEVGRASRGGDEERASAWKRLLACKSGIPGRFAAMQRELYGENTDMERCLEHLESDVAVSLSKLTWITRIGPMLGLMGTLIPLGPALTGLATGDITALSSNLVVAFTTTVLGVFIGCAGFTMSLVRRNWYNRDMSNLEHIVARITERSSANAQKNEKMG